MMEKRKPITVQLGRDVADVVARIPDDLRALKRAMRAMNGDTLGSQTTPMQIITINVPRTWVKWLDKANPAFQSRSEAIRVAIRDFIIQQSRIDERVMEMIE